MYSIKGYRRTVMTAPFIPIWIIGGPFVGLLILAFSFKGSSSLSGGRGLRSDTFEVTERKNTIAY
jgi:hypothetical protein